MISAMEVGSNLSFTLFSLIVCLTVIATHYLNRPKQ